MRDRTANPGGFTRIILCALMVSGVFGVVSGILVGSNMSASVPVPGSALLADVRVLNSLAVPPWVVAKHGDEVLAIRGICPEVEILCLRVQSLRLFDELGRGKFESERKKATRGRMAAVNKRIETLESFAEARDGAEDYMTMVSLDALIVQESYSEIFIETLKRKAMAGRLRWQEARRLVPILFMADDRYEGLSLLEPRPGVFGVETPKADSSDLAFPEAGEVLIALGHTQDVRLLGQIAQYMVDDQSARALEYLCCLLPEGEEILCGERPTRKLWEKVLHALEGRLVWAGGMWKFYHPTISQSMSSEALPASQRSEEPPAAFFKVSWPAVYLDKDVSLGNGSFKTPLTKEDSQRLAAFAKLSEAQQKAAAIALLRDRLRASESTARKATATSGSSEK